MTHFKSIAVTVLAILVPACGQQLVEFGADGGAAGNPSAGRGGKAGNGGGSNDGGNQQAEAGAGNAGQSSVAGAGAGGEGGLGGVAAAGEGGAAGVGGEAGMAGETTQLVVVSTNPADRDRNVALNKTISATFNQPMNPLTASAGFTIVGPGKTPVPGVVSVTGSVATFAPNANLAPSTTFKGAITRAASSLSGDVLADDYVWTFRTGTEAAQLLPQLPVPLGSASGFVVLASAAITNLSTSDITGNVGLTPDAGSNISGFSVPATCPEVNGLVYAVDASGPACALINPVLLANAKTDTAVAFTNANAAVRGTPQAVSGNLNGLTLYPGLYESGSSIQLSPGGFLYLDAQGDEDAIFIIRSATSITTAAGSEVVLTKGAKASNVYWTAGSATTLGTNSIMKGSVLAGTGISLLTGADLEGRALNQGAAAAAITIDSSTITLPTP
jgi:hypothetical protein